MKICFETAWAPPFALIQKLSTLFPNNEFTLLGGEDETTMSAVFVNGEQGREQVY